MTAPDTAGAGAARAMNAALLDAGLEPRDIDYINAHGTATKFNDAAETAAIRSVFRGHADKLAVSSIKSMIGHCLGAAGGIEAVATALTVYHGIIPPTINFDTPDPQCDINCTPNNARRVDVRAALSNSLAFGGNNTSVVFKRAI
jgi:3-oxoacyl-[acyl-carrier-protein] synthase II